MVTRRIRWDYIAAVAGIAALVAVMLALREDNHEDVPDNVPVASGTVQPRVLGAADCLVPCDRGGVDDGGGGRADDPHPTEDRRRGAGTATEVPPGEPTERPTDYPPAAPTSAPLEPTPGVTAPPVREPPAFGPGALEALICSYPWPCQTMIMVAHCESGPTDFSLPLDGPWAQNGSVYGLFQVHSIHAWRWADFWTSWMDPARNTQWAFELWSEQGLRPWKASGPTGNGCWWEEAA